MRWGKVEVEAGFLLVVALALYWDNQGVVMLALLACTLHEVGHIIVLRWVGGRLRRLRLTAVGAEMIIEGNLSYGKSLMVSLAGPLSNLLIALLMAQSGKGALFCGLNLALCLLNLVPLRQLDGGGALYALCGMVWGGVVAERVSHMLNGCCVMVLLVFGVAVLAVGGSFTLLLLALWVGCTQKTLKFHKKRLA